MAQRQDTEDGQSYERHLVQLIRQIATRAGNVDKDEDFVNVFPEIVQDKQSGDNRKFMMKRSGSTSLIASVASTEVRGQFYWIDQGKFLYSVGRNVYVYTISTASTVTLNNVFVSTTGDIGFTEYLYDNNTVVIMATDGTTLVQIDAANVVTTCTDPDLPAHLPSPVFIDGYLLLIKSGTADIYNSDLNNPLSWTAGNFISAELSPDLLTRICKVNNYVVALGTESAEYFWDSGNATGSPLTRNDSPVKINTFLGGLSQYGNDIYYIGRNFAGQPSVFMLKDFKIEELGTPTIARYLALNSESMITWRTSIVSMQGHNFLLVSAGTKTYVYDLDEKLWSRFSYQASGVFDIKYSTTVHTTTNVITLFSLKGASSTIYTFNDALMQDSGVNYTCQVITEPNDFGTMNRKTMARLTVVADRTPVDSNISLYWSDDDYQSYQGPRMINLNQDLQCTYVLGSFRQRAFKLLYTGPYIMRLQHLEADINKGIS